MILVIKISEPTGNCSGFIKRISAKIPTILYTFDPKIVPTARLDCFLKAAAMPVASSGRDVPKATKVKPIMVSGKWVEIDTPEDLDIARKVFANIDH